MEDTSANLDIDGGSDISKDYTLACPAPFTQSARVLLAHGGGGKLMLDLIENMFVKGFSNSLLAARHDGAMFSLNGIRLAFTTDSYVVRPLFFPGGDIGSLAVNGTVNDLAMCGARPLYLSTGFILEEGLPMEMLWRVVQSMREAADAAGVQLVTGDTKVVDRGKADKLFINTAGVGLIEHDISINPASVKTGDMILLNGDLGRHGIAIMAVREGLEFETVIESDCAPVADLVLKLIAEGIEIHCLRDLTRGGLTSALIEISEAGGVHCEIDEAAIPVREDVQGACEILGFDPLYLANEGRFVAFVAAQDAERALALMKQHPMGPGACLIGRVTDEATNYVTLKSAIGTSRILDMFTGEQLPRIC